MGKDFQESLSGHWEKWPQEEPRRNGLPGMGGELG